MVRVPKRSIVMSAGIVMALVASATVALAYGSWHERSFRGSVRDLPVLRAAVRPGGINASSSSTSRTRASTKRSVQPHPPPI